MRGRSTKHNGAAGGLRSIFLRPLSPYGFAVTTGQIEKYGSERWLAFYKQGLEYILELNRHGYGISKEHRDELQDLATEAWKLNSESAR